MSADEITGGCLCGDVSFHASGPRHRVAHCHCGMCRRAVGAVVATFATFESSHVEWRGQLARGQACSETRIAHGAKCQKSSPGLLVMVEMLGSPAFFPSYGLEHYFS